MTSPIIATYVFEKEATARKLFRLWNRIQVLFFHLIVRE